MQDRTPSEMLTDKNHDNPEEEMLDQDRDVESFGISPDGTRLTVARIEHFRTIKVAEGVPGLE